MRSSPLAWLVVAACTSTVSAPVISTTTTSGATTTTSTTSTTAPLVTTTTAIDCTPVDRSAGLVFHPAVAPVEWSIELSAGIFPCADHVVVASTGAPRAIETGSAIANQDGGPLLLVGADVSAVVAELDRLQPRRVTTVGLDPATLQSLGRFEPEVRPLGAPPATDLPAGLAGLWLIDAAAGDSIAPTMAAARATGAKAILLERLDLRRQPPEITVAIRAAGTPIHLVGGFNEAAVWQLEVVRAGLEIPGGGQVMFPGRILVALYGAPGYSGLGALGQQGPTETVERLRPLAAEYAAGGAQVLPTFELIATIAAASAGADGDYSEELPVEALRPWVDAAAEHGVYVVLDLQPGRTDFLTQAKLYRELLALPHVGLALDPEWRLGPDQVHLRQIGTVSAAEINMVSQWLAEVVRDEALPQKLFLIHEFKLSMITDREQITAPSELAVVIQMDGQGPLPSKYGTYAAVVAGAEEAPWEWGWKNFYELDTPLATPAELLDLDPLPVFFSYQ